MLLSKTKKKSILNQILKINHETNSPTEFISGLLKICKHNNISPVDIQIWKIELELTFDEFFLFTKKFTKEDGNTKYCIPLWEKDMENIKDFENLNVPNELMIARGPKDLLHKFAKDFELNMEINLENLTNCGFCWNKNKFEDFKEISDSEGKILKPKDLKELIFLSKSITKIFLNNNEKELFTLHLNVSEILKPILNEKDIINKLLENYNQNICLLTEFIISSIKKMFENEKNQKDILDSTGSSGYLIVKIIIQSCILKK